MTSTCTPNLLHDHPFPPATVAAEGLPAMADVFADFRNAKPGQPVGLALIVIKDADFIRTTAPAKILVRQGNGKSFDALGVRDALARPDLRDALELAAHTTTHVQAPYDYTGTGWTRHNWHPTRSENFMETRTLWILPRAALLMDNLQPCVVRRVQDLAYFANVFFDPVTSAHETLSLKVYLEALLKITSRAAVPNVVDAWPQGLPERRAPFGPFDTARLEPIRARR